MVTGAASPPGAAAGAAAVALASAGAVAFASAAAASAGAAVLASCAMAGALAVISATAPTRARRGFILLVSSIVRQFLVDRTLKTQGRRARAFLPHTVRTRFVLRRSEPLFAAPSRCTVAYLF